MIILIILVIQLCISAYASSEFIIQGTNPPSLINKCGFGSPEIWEISIPVDTDEQKDVAKKFESLKNIIIDGDVEKKYELKNVPCTKDDVNRLMQFAIPGKQVDINTVIHSTLELITTLQLADNLDANHPIKATILQSRYTEELLKKIFPHPQSEAAASVKDCIIDTLTKSDSLKTKFELCLYEMLYTCPEWLETDYALNNLDTTPISYPHQYYRDVPGTSHYKSYCTRLDNITFERHDPAMVTWIISSSSWQKSEIYKAYNTIFDNECTKTITRYLDAYTRDATTIVNQQETENLHWDRSRQEKINNLSTTHILIKYNPTHVWVHMQSSKTHLPLLFHILHYYAYLSPLHYPHDKYGSYQNIESIHFNIENAATTHLHAVDICALNRHNKKFACEIDNLSTNSTQYLQLCSKKLQFRLNKSSPELITAVLNKFVENNFTHEGQSSIEAYIVDPYWRFKILLPWVVMGITTVCAYYAFKPYYVSKLQSIENKKIAAFENIKSTINNLHMDGADSTLFKKHYFAEWSEPPGPITSSLIPAPTPQQSYTSDQVDRSFKIYKEINDTCANYISIRDNIPNDKRFTMSVFGSCTVISAIIASKLWNWLFSTKFYNPLKIIFYPLKKRYNGDIPRRCSVTLYKN